MTPVLAGSVVVAPGAEDAAGLLAALAGKAAGPAADPLVPAPDPGGAGQARALVCRAAGAGAPGEDRIQILLELLLERLLSSPQPPDGARLHLVLPPADTPRGARLDPARLRRDLCREPAAGDLDPVLEHQAGPVAAHLRAACEALARGEAEEILFGAVDSLLDPLTLDRLGRAGQLETGAGTGVVPGEAAAVVRLRAAAPEPGGVVLAGLALATEPHAGRPHRERQTGLAAALREAAGGQMPDAVIHAAGCRRLHLLEWHQVQGALWPPPPPADPGAAAEPQAAGATGSGEAPEAGEVPGPGGAPEELNLGLAVGDAGAAALPLALALGCARLLEGEPPAASAVACEWEAGPGRAAVRLARPDAAGHHEDSDTLQGDAA